MIFTRSHRLCCGLPIILAVLFATPLYAASLKDLLDPDRLAKVVKAKEERKAALAERARELSRAIADYQWERGKRTCEAVLWQGRAPDIQELRDLRKEARKEVDAILDTLKSGLEDKQAERIDKLLKGKENLLDIPVSDHPFHHINNTPLFPRFQDSGKAYRISLPGAPSPDNTWSYADLLSTWTVRGFIPAESPLDGRNPSGSIADQSHLQVRDLSPQIRERIVRSPLLLAATLLVPDLGQSELDLLWDHYPRDADAKKDAMWARYRAQNRLDDAILVRLKMSTPFSELYLDLDRWVIYLEDSEGIGYEPVQIVQEASRPIETLKISLPGREVEVTDVFGNYYPYIPGNKETIYLAAPAKLTYTGHEKLVKLFFPVENFQKQPIVTEKTKSLKLIVQSQADDYGRSELVWELKRQKPGKP